MLKYLYVCTSSQRDLFLEQTFASIVSLKQKIPKAFVVLLIDNCTEQTLSDGRERIKDLVDELVVRNLDANLSGKVRSRILKTSMRNCVDGDFLYIDSDTVILEDLSEIENVPCDLGGVQDSHVSLSKNPMLQKKNHLKELSKLNSDKAFLTCEIYINSGVLFVRDVPKNRDFFRLWNKYYLEFLKKENISQDQPTLALVNYLMGFPIYELNGKWNCQLNYGASFYWKVKILHYFSSVNIPGAVQEIYELIRKYAFDAKARACALDQLEEKVFNFGPSVVTKGREYDLMRTASYRLLLLIFSSFPKVFALFEKIASLGRGRGLYLKMKRRA